MAAGRRRRFADAMAEDVGEAEQDRQLDAAELQLIDELLEVDGLCGILRRVDANVAIRADREVALAPSIDLVEFGRIGDRPGSPMPTASAVAWSTCSRNHDKRKSAFVIGRSTNFCARGTPRPQFLRQTMSPNAAGGIERSEPSVTAAHRQSPFARASARRMDASLRRRQVLEPRRPLDPRAKAELPASSGERRAQCAGRLDGAASWRTFTGHRCRIIAAIAPSSNSRAGLPCNSVTASRKRSASGGCPRDARAAGGAAARSCRAAAAAPAESARRRFGRQSGAGRAPGCEHRRGVLRAAGPEEGP